MMRTLAPLFALAACRFDVHHGVDAAPADVAPDTVAPSSDDPPANAVKLTITRNGVPVVGVAVVFQNADSSLVHAGLTNQQGLAWAIMESGGYVTALERQGDGLDELTTFSAVQAADALELAFAPTGDTMAWPLVLDIPSDSGAASHQVYTTCGGPFGLDPAVPSEIQLIGCKAMADFVVESVDAEGAPVRSFYTPSIQIPDPPPQPETDAMPPVYPMLNLVGTYQAPATKTFAYANVPAFVSFLGVYHAFASTHGRVYERTAGASPTGSTASAQLQLPATSAGSLVATNLYSTGIGAQTIFEASTSAATTYSLDIGASLLPPFASAPSFDVASHTVTWTEDNAALAPDFVRTRIHVYRDDLPSGRAWGWRMIAPRTATSVTYPTLPVYGFDFNPQATDTVGVNELTTADVPGGFAAVRRTGFGDLTQKLIGTSDRMVVQTLNALEL